MTEHLACYYSLVGFCPFSKTLQSNSFQEVTVQKYLFVDSPSQETVSNTSLSLKTDYLERPVLCMSHCHFFNDYTSPRTIFTQGWPSQNRAEEALCVTAVPQLEDVEGHTEHTEMFLRREDVTENLGLNIKQCVGAFHMCESQSIRLKPLFIHGIIYGYWYEWKCHFNCIIKCKSVSPQTQLMSTNAASTQLFPYRRSFGFTGVRLTSRQSHSKRWYQTT